MEIVLDLKNRYVFSCKGGNYLNSSQPVRINSLPAVEEKRSFLKECIKQKYLLLMILPGFLIVFIFNYIPIYGILIAFKNYNVAKGVWASQWVGMKYFNMFFANPLAFRLFKNTILLGFYSLLWSFPAPIILALLLNENRNTMFKRVVQTISYIPHFISVVVIVGMLSEFTAVDGIFNKIIQVIGFQPFPMMASKELFRTLFIGSGIWQGIGWGTIIYLAAISGVDSTLYDVADIDGANRWQKMLNITWPTIRPTTTILLILNLGGILGADYQKVMLMYNSNVMEVADVIGTYVYREGIQGARFEYTTAIGLFLSVISFVFVYAGNFISRKVSENSLW
jgi:ABC-type polysaccharide transport system, permease component